MKNNYLKTRLKELQNNYCTVLRKSVNDLESDNFAYIADEINLFWFRYRKIVRIILDNFKNGDTVLFTGTTFIDIKDKELFPFFICGDSHVIDDSFANLSSLSINMADNKFKQDLKKNLIRSAKDNIEIIENYSDSFSILPVSFLSQKAMDFIHKQADKAFLDLFPISNLSTVEDFFKKYKKVEDAVNEIPKVIHEAIIFDEYDNENKSLLERFILFKSSGSSPFPANTPDVVVFYSLIKGFFMRAISILFMAADYNFIPYLRYPLIFQYFGILGERFLTHPVLGELIFKCICSHLIYKNFDKNRVHNIDFKSFSNNVQVKDFKAHFYKQLAKQNISPSKIDFNIIRKVSNESIEKMFNGFAKNSI